MRSSAHSRSTYILASAGSESFGLWKRWMFAADPAPEQRERRGEPADAAAGNQDTRLHLRATGEDGAASYRFTASAPALQTTSSCEPVPPEQPMAPTSLPPSRMGMPPRDAMTSSRVRR